MPKTLVSIAICTWNRAKRLDEVLASMVNLKIPLDVDWEILVVNNNCTDDTDAVVARHAGRLPLRRVLEEEAGISYARNRAITEAAGDFLLWIDDDASPDPDWLIAHLEAFEAFDAHLVIGKVEPKWEAGAPPRWYGPEFRGMFALLDYGNELRLVTDPREAGFNVNLGFRRSLVETIGAYRKDIGAGRMAGGEDQDICRRAHEAGLRVAYQPKALVHHFIPASRCTKAFYRRYTWGGSLNHLKLLEDEAHRVPSLFGMPRYFLRMHLGFLGKYIAGVVRNRPGQAFFYELKMIRLVGLFWFKFRHKNPAHITERAGE